MWSEPLEFGKLTWPEVARAAGEERVPVVPIGTLEDHGYHLPIDTDVVLVEAVCRGAAERLPAETVLLPPIVHGYSPHHMDFPGTITINWDTFCRYCTDVALSLVRHGFERVLLVNGHGSNQNLVETAARLAMVEEPGSLVAASFYLVSERSARVIEEVRDSDRGGMAHACELETSLYLHLQPEAVDMSEAVDERGVPAPASPYHNRSEVLRGVEWWESKGYKVKLGRNVFARDAYVAGDPKSRASDLMEMFTDDEVDVVQSFQGGYGSAQVIEHLDFDAIGANPKAFIGYSDITALHTALRHHTGLVTFYGPGLAGVNDRETKPFTRERLLGALTSSEPLGEVPRDPKNNYIRAFGGGSVTAPMVGGCLWLLCQAIG